MTRFPYLFVFLTVLFLYPSCKPTETLNPCQHNFDLGSTYIHLADNLIIPSYNNLNNEVIELETKINSFLSDLSVQKLEEVQDQWLIAARQSQYAAIYEFGPAEEVFLRSSLHNFPVNTGEVNVNIQTNSYDFDLPDAYDKGFPAIEYLIFGLAENNVDRLAFFTTDPLAENYKTYLVALVQDIKQRSTYTLNGWNNGYRDQFINNLGTADDNTLSLLVNNFNEYFEWVKRDKLGVPSGILSGINLAFPQAVEAFYSKQSNTLLLASIDACKKFYQGFGVNGNNGLGFDDFLVELNTQKEDQALSTLINTQFSSIEQAINAFTVPLSEGVNTETALVQTAYVETSNQVVYIKTDMPSVFCIAITYVDNPSDSD